MREEAGAEQAHISTTQHSTAAPGREGFDVALVQAQTNASKAVSSRETGKSTGHMT
jgi:hypothetical protein